MQTSLDEFAELLEGWRRDGRDGVLVRVVEYEGFGGARRGELLALADDGTRAGGLLGGSLDAELVPAARSLAGGATVLAAEVHGPAATAAGLTCGGRANAVLQRLDAIPPAFWQALRERRAVALVSPPAGEPVLVVPAGAARAGTLGDAEADDLAEAEARARLARSRPLAERSTESGFLIQTYHPRRRLLVVGAADLADAIVEQAALLDWEARVTATLEDSERELARLGAADALVVLSHDGSVDAPVLAAARARGVGYVGALGSRGTQQNRRARLRALDVPDAWIDGIYGPIGLDLAAATPAETALAVCAEILADAAGRVPVSLRDTAGPINAAMSAVESLR
jgi:xanthine dehydrogenase accessory factor